MIAQSGKESFFVAHYDWLAVAVGVAALVAAGVFFVMTLDADPDEAAAGEAAGVERMRPREMGVDPTDMSEFQTAVKLTRVPATVQDIPEKSGNFLASERWVMCECGQASLGDVKKEPNCPNCHKPKVVLGPVVLDADGDGMADEWEKKYGLNPSDPADAAQDKDGDGFTNLEEYMAKTDPTDKADHPDYLDSIKVVLPLKQTYMPFVFTKATQVPGGWRCEFFDATKKDLKRGSTGIVRAKVGEEIPGYGFVLKSYETKSEKRKKPGMNMMMSVDVSEVVVERKTDGKKVTLVIVQTEKDMKPVPLDVQVTLVYERGEAKNLEVVPGAEIDLSGTKYRVLAIKPVAVDKGAKLTFKNVLTGEERVIECP